MKTNMRRRIAVIASACIAVPLITLVGAGPASADTDQIQETTGYGYAISWDHPRTNFNNPSASTFTLNSMDPNPAGDFVVGLRNGSGQFARGVATIGNSASLAMSNGSTELPRGTFYLNTKVEGACGGDGCGDITWNITFNWNL